MTAFVETGRLTLRRFTALDVDLLVDLDSDPDVMFFITGGRPTPRDEIGPARVIRVSGDPRRGLRHSGALQHSGRPVAGTG